MRTSLADKFVPVFVVRFPGSFLALAADLSRLDVGWCFVLRCSLSHFGNRLGSIVVQFSYFSQFLLFLVAGSGGGGGVEGGRRGPQRRAVVGAAGDPTARQALAEPECARRLRPGEHLALLDIQLLHLLLHRRHRHGRHRRLGLQVSRHRQVVVLPDLKVVVVGAVDGALPEAAGFGDAVRHGATGV